MTSNYWRDHSLFATMDIRIRIVLSLATGAKVSWQSIPYFWAYPLATSLALYLSRLPSALSLTVYIHLHPIAFFPSGNTTSSQVEFFCKAFISSFIASFHFGFANASCTLLGMDTLDN